MSASTFRALNDESDWSDALSRSIDHPVLLFKHSAACPISDKANQEMQQLATEEDLPVYKLVVQESRALSDEIADALEVGHETPQAILLDDQEPVFNTSHYDVTADTLREVVHSLD